MSESAAGADDSDSIVERLADGTEYYVVHDGGHGDGMVEEGPFRVPSTAIKAKNRLQRTSHWLCKFRVQAVPPEEAND